MNEHDEFDEMSDGDTAEMFVPALPPSRLSRWGLPKNRETARLLRRSLLRDERSYWLRMIALSVFFIGGMVAAYNFVPSGTLAYWWGLVLFAFLPNAIMLPPSIECGSYAETMRKLVDGGDWEDLILTRYAGREWADGVATLARRRASHLALIQIASAGVAVGIGLELVKGVSVWWGLAVLPFFLPISMFHRSVSDRTRVRLEEAAVRNGWGNAGALSTVSLFGHVLESILTWLFVGLGIRGLVYVALAMVGFAVMADTLFAAIPSLLAPFLVEGYFLHAGTRICHEKRAAMGPHLQFAQRERTDD